MRIKVIHNKVEVISISVNGEALQVEYKSIIKTIFHLSERFPNALLIWLNVEFQNIFNEKSISEIFHHDLIMASYDYKKELFLGPSLGYIDRNPFINVNFNVSYPTWFMSSDVGGVNTQLISQFNFNTYHKRSFDFFLNSIANRSINSGIFCYSEPKLFVNPIFERNSFERKKDAEFYRFVREHYSLKKNILLLLIFFLKEKRYNFLTALKSIVFLKKLKPVRLDKSNMKPIANLSESLSLEIDVIIPTLGRKELIYDVVQDLKRQTLLPKSVIIVEQNPDKDSSSQLGFLKTESWPFKIKHYFTNETGVCKARNLALQNVDSDWVFMCDDDNRFNSTLLKDFLFHVEKYSVKAANTSYLQDGEIENNLNIKQGASFGSGNAFVHKDIFKFIKFNLSFENGYGEDVDYGLQIRNSGYDVVYFPNLKIDHVKAESGGFRAKPKLLWDNDIVKPKPSPTVTLGKLLNDTPEQLYGYKIVSFFKFYKYQAVKNPIQYYRNFKKQWDRSLYWANHLRNNR